MLHGVPSVFRNAYAIASKFTFPIIVSTRTRDGKCSASVGAYVLINADGWIVTAGHILKQLVDLVAAVQKTNDHAANEAAIRADTTIDDKVRRSRLKALGHLTGDDFTHVSAFWGGAPTIPSLSDIQILEPVDVGIGKLPGFSPPPGQTYPIFKDPTKDFDPGTSLCKLGFPFHSITPTFDVPTQRFQLPASALPVPFFPIEGIFTRVAQPDMQGNPGPGFPLLMVETSSPGLRGQSGGPIFDTKGTIWAIQSITSHLELGFRTAIQQFLNVGLGVHTETLFNVFGQAAVNYQVSTY
jgi:hypothetical protein